MKRATLAMIAALLTVWLPNGSTGATEIVTRCPIAAPGDAELKIVRRQLNHFGDHPIAGGTEPSLEISDRRHLYGRTELEAENFTGAALQCEYRGGTPLREVKLRVQIVGTLLRCEWIERRLAGQSGRTEPIDVWCTSRIEPPAR